MKRPAVALVAVVLGIVAVFVVLQVGTPALASANSDPVSKICPGKLALSLAGKTQLLPYCTSQSLDRVDSGIGLLVVAIHGSDRKAEDALNAITKAVAAAGARARGTLVVAPQFLMDVDTAAHHLSSDVLRWRRLAGGADWEEGWDQGNDSDSVTSAVSSFAVLDAVLEKVVSGTQFPNLKRIVVAGLSLGAQFVNRYAAGTQVEQKLLADRGIRVRYVVAAPSSYLYFDERRPTNGTAAGFAAPSAEQRAQCPSWNSYRYGLENLNRCMLAVGEEAIRAQYAAREVAYIIGLDDKEGEMSCAARLQGTNRLERARNYWSYLQSFFGAGITSRQALSVVPGVGHSWSLFTSRCGLEYLFSKELASACMP
jgi:hypothetical protein